MLMAWPPAGNSATCFTIRIDGSILSREMEACCFLNDILCVQPMLFFACCSHMYKMAAALGISAALTGGTTALLSTLHFLTIRGDMCKVRDVCSTAVRRFGY